MSLLFCDSRTEKDGVDIQIDVGSDFVSGCGVEVGSIDSFFSLERFQTGVDVNVSNFRLRKFLNGWGFKAKVNMPSASLKVEESAIIGANDGERRLKITAVDDSKLMDAVLRFVIDKNLVEAAFINEFEVRHRNINKYNQHPFSNIVLRLFNGKKIEFKPQVAHGHEGLLPVVYLRDERRFWILHVRLIAMRPDFYIFKGCHRFYNKPFPLFFQTIVRSIPRLQTWLLYVRERVSQRIPFQSNAAILLKRNQFIKFSVSWRLHDE